MSKNIPFKSDVELDFATTTIMECVPILLFNGIRMENAGMGQSLHVFQGLPDLLQAADFQPMRPSLDFSDDFS